MSTDERIAQIERQLARVKWVNRILVACIVIFFAVWFVSKTFSPETAWAKSGKKTIQATDLLLQDENGKTCAMLMGGTEGVLLTSVDANDNPGVGLLLRKNGLMVVDENMSTRISLIGSKDSTALLLYDKNSIPRVALTLANGQPAVIICDGNRKPIWTAP